MRADRLLSILMTLQLRGRVTAEVLAEQLEVSVRTIYRDVEALGQAGIPLFADRGRTGGIRLFDGYQTKLTGLSADEAQALPFVGFGAAAAALGLAGTAKSAQLKMFAALPLSGRERAYRASQRFHLDPADWYRRPATPPHLKSVAEAVWEGCAIEMDYESWRSRSKRVVEPLGLVLKAGTWYLVGRRSKRVSIYLVESIRQVRVLSGRMVQTRGLDLAALWQSEVSRFQASLRRAKAKIRVAESAMSRVDRLGADASEAIRAATPGHGGWRIATIWMESISHAAGMLLGFGIDIEVIAPEALRAELAARARAVSDLYR
jgi:predicted DNA-binding transcriptional regulator YafY